MTTQTQTLGTWTATSTGATIVASYFDTDNVRLDAEGSSRVLTNQEWAQMLGNMKRAGYRLV